MINRLQLLRNIGQFDSVSGGGSIPLAQLTLIYAENGRGKTTLSAVLRSLATGDPIPIAERRRLTAQHPPHVVLDCAGGPPPAIFDNNAWNRTLPNVVVFDDMFVDENVYSGLVVGPEHRQNLHELILGAQGVGLNRQIQQLVAQIEAHNAVLRTKAAAIPVAERGNFSVDDFCGLEERPDIAEEVQAAERNLAAAREQDSIREAPAFNILRLPLFDIAETEGILQQDLPGLEAAACLRVQAHLAESGPDTEAWVAEGMRRLPEAGTDGPMGACPFCAQDLSESPIINHYRAYFSDAYRELKLTISEALASVNRTHGGDVPAGFERAVRVVGEQRQFWSRFCDTPDVTVDTAAIVRDWRAAREAVTQALNAKQASPLERMRLSNAARAALATYDRHRESIEILSQDLQDTNRAIQLVKEQAAAGNPAALAADVARLKAVRARHTPAVAALCGEYLTQKANKANTEELRDQAKEALDQYRANAIPGYQVAVNLYLQRFNAGFRLDGVTPTNTRGGPTCTYTVVIDSVPVSVSGGDPVRGQPSFRSTLSAGDRNTLALAFFFASLDQDPCLADKIVIIDDPVSSLDEHRSLTTVQEIRRLAPRTSQVIVLSHNKSFLCRIWEGADRTQRAALEVARDRTGSTLAAWNVDQDSVTEYDRRHALLREYVEAGALCNREVAYAIRPVLEGFLRVACPEHFRPGTLLGPFRSVCEERAGTSREILSVQLTQELRDLTEYGNRFHHDTNPAWETETINDGELRGFVLRVLDFTSK